MWFCHHGSMYENLKNIDGCLGTQYIWIYVSTPIKKKEEKIQKISCV